MSSELKIATSSKTTIPATQSVGPQAIQKKAVGVIQNMEALEADKEHEAVPVQKKENKTGMPDNLKSGIENLSGMSMDHVKVHYNSSQPAQLNALAYAQGSDIHIGPGQEKHLPHEAWHVVQQAQGRVQPTKQMKAGVPVNDDAGLEHEADVMGAKALSYVHSSINLLTQLRQEPVLKAIVQKQPMIANVIWNRTHVVKEMNNSLFGNSDYLEGEIGLPGELVNGQIIVVEDSDIFISRRGANQEEDSVRSKQRNNEPSFEWIRVIKIKSADVTNLNVYVRAETIRLMRPEEGYDESLGRKKIFISEIDWKDVKIDLAAEKIGEEWVDLGGEEDKDKGEYQCSGDDYNIKDEGVDVANDLKNKEQRRPAPVENQTYSKTFIAHYDDHEPIAIMQLEMRREQKGSDTNHLYVRWLLGSPIRKGGGSALVALAKVEAIKEAEGELRVESARAAEKWYKGQDFRTLYASEHETDYANFGAENPVEPEECGCKFMTWTKTSF